ncbi:MAG TPA: ATP-binding cassette domain-containing protein [Acidobacteriota bacterium]|nr:ATP-binding cassette domain-containing protein [Acidobacteriota bacterium]
MPGSGIYYQVFFKYFVFAIFAFYLVLLTALLGRKFLGGRGKSRGEQIFGSKHKAEEDGTFLQVISLYKAFDYPVLEGIDLRIQEGETLGVLGMSGTGKSVMLKLVAGLLKPDKGYILYRGRDITKMNEGDLLEYRKRVTYVFQMGAVFDFLNVRENIAYPLREEGVTDEDFIRERVDYLLDAVELEGQGDLHVSELSLGSKKQVAIARAIAEEPEAILYDEPTTGVDPLIGKSLSRLIRKLNKQEKLTSIVVTHDMRCLRIVSDRIILLKDGNIHFEGTPDAFYTSDDPFVQAFIAGKRIDEEIAETA